MPAIASANPLAGGCAPPSAPPPSSLQFAGGQPRGARLLTAVIRFLLSPFRSSRTVGISPSLVRFLSPFFFFFSFFLFLLPSNLRLEECSHGCLLRWTVARFTAGNAMVARRITGDRSGAIRWNFLRSFSDNENNRGSSWMLKKCNNSYPAVSYGNLARETSFFSFANWSGTLLSFSPLQQFI